jgi:NSS family neurotransmitter:Na+ symporter
MVAYGSNQPKDSKIVKNAWIVAASNACFSIFAGFAVFAILGNLAVVAPNVESVADFGDDIAGFQLSFVTFPVALNQMPGSNFFAFLFFIMLLSLGLDSAMSLIEAQMGLLKDISPYVRAHVPQVTAIVCFSQFLLGLVMCTPSGQYVMDIIDHFSATYCFLVTGLLECFTVGWQYDIADYREHRDLRRLLTDNKLAREIAAATGDDTSRLPVCWAIMVKFVTPSIVLSLFIYNMRGDFEESYNGYPVWANAIFGWIPCVCVPLFAMIYSLAGFKSPCIADKRTTALQGPLLGGDAM